MITCIIDKDGYIVNPCIEKKKISEEDIYVHVLNDYSLIKPKWDFNKQTWTEGATEQEIKGWEESNKPPEKEPSETDLLKIELAENTKDLAKKDLEIEQLQKDIADITKQLAVGGDI